MVATATKPKEFFAQSRPVVYNANSPNPSAWTDLDLSAFVGSRYAFVMLRFYSNVAGNAGYAIKPAFEAGDCLPNAFPANSGGCHSIDLVQNKPGYICINTSQIGHIEWYCDAVDRLTQVSIQFFIA